MNLRGFILGTVAANLALVALLLWQVAQVPAPAARGGLSVTTNVVNEVVHEPSLRPAVVSVPGSPPFRWDQLESTNHLRFLTNLLAIGCPPETARDILDARIADDFRARLRELTRPLQARFWEVAAEGEIDHLVKNTPVEKEIETLKEERRHVQKDLQAAIPPVEKSGPPGRNELVGHLSEDKQAQLKTLKDGQAKEREALKLEVAKIPPSERSAKEKELIQRQQAERRALFSDTEWAEAELRGSSQARQVRESRGHNATPDELRALARTLGEFDAEHPRPTPRDPRRPADDPDYKPKLEEREAQRKAFLTARLGEAGFAAFERGSDPRFHTLQKLARRLELAPASAAQWLELQTAAQDQIRQMSQNADLAASARGLAIAAIRAETERTLKAAVGARGWGAYQRHAGDWLKQLDK